MGEILVGFHGANGSFIHQALIDYMSAAERSILCHPFEYVEVATGSLRSGDVQELFVEVENNKTGYNHSVPNILADPYSDLWVVGEHYQHIAYHVMVTPEVARAYATLTQALPCLKEYIGDMAGAADFEQRLSEHVFSCFPTAAQAAQHVRIKEQEDLAAFVPKHVGASEGLVSLGTLTSDKETYRRYFHLIPGSEQKHYPGLFPQWSDKHVTVAAILSASPDPFSFCLQDAATVLAKHNIRIMRDERILDGTFGNNHRFVELNVRFIRGWESFVRFESARKDLINVCRMTLKGCFKSQRQPELRSQFG